MLPNRVAVSAIQLSQEFCKIFNNYGLMLDPFLSHSFDRFSKLSETSSESDRRAKVDSRVSLVET